MTINKKENKRMLERRTRATTTLLIPKQKARNPWNIEALDLSHSGHKSFTTRLWNCKPSRAVANPTPPNSKPCICVPMPRKRKKTIATFVISGVNVVVPTGTNASLPIREKVPVLRRRLNPVPKRRANVLPTKRENATRVTSVPFLMILHPHARRLVQQLTTMPPPKQRNRHTRIFRPPKRIASIGKPRANVARVTNVRTVTIPNGWKRYKPRKTNARRRRNQNQHPETIIMTTTNGPKSSKDNPFAFGCLACRTKRQNRIYARIFKIVARFPKLPFPPFPIRDGVRGIVKYGSPLPRL
mmetsp:Transcript_3799/g.8051  ORF Transcript_3799/g.8051 Transcript_3799/m.8051 type:complete len:299 (-) Transcript_3799:271-1167(-)